MAGKGARRGGLEADSSAFERAFLPIEAAIEAYVDAGAGAETGCGRIPKLAKVNEEEVFCCVPGTATASFFWFLASKGFTASSTLYQILPSASL